MKFTNEFVEAIRRKKENMQFLLGGNELSEIEIGLKKQLYTHWNVLPIREASNLREFCVDSSSFARTLANGVDVFFVGALMLGREGFQKKKVEFDARPSIADPGLSDKFERLLRDWIEIEIVIENCPEHKGDLVLIDGNLYDRYIHQMEQINIRGREHLPLQLLEAMQKMFDMCHKRGVIVAGVSKFSKTRALSNAFLDELGYSRSTFDIPDVLMLDKWKRGETGFTTPILLGEWGFGEDVKSIQEKPEGYLQRYFRDLPKSFYDWGVEVIEKIPLAPAIAMFHMIPEVSDQPLRIDIPVNCLGLKEKFLDVSSPRFVDMYVVEDVLRQLLIDRGGRDVYNALLYVVDQEVRLSPRMVDTIYKSILGSELNLSIEYDRSTRRFYG